VLDIQEFGALLKTRGLHFASGVPCSFLKELINYASSSLQYIIAAQEGEAVAIAAGAHLAGKKASVLMQNSGLTNAVNPLTSLNYPFQIPVLGFVGWRGEPGHGDEPEHWLTGEITGSMLDLCKIPNAVLSKNIAEARQQLDLALDHLGGNKPFFFIVQKDTFTRAPLPGGIEIENYSQEIIDGKVHPVKPSRLQVLGKVIQYKDGKTVLVASTGKCGRELFELDDSPHNLYMIGSMGCASSIGLGISMVRPDTRVIILDGDGALLMRMGSLATNGYYRPRNLFHILLDNRSHDSTGGQDTVSGNVGWCRIAHEAGYVRAVRVNDTEEIGGYIAQWKKDPVLTFLHVEVAKGSKKDLGRPTVQPAEVKERLMAFLNR